MRFAGKTIIVTGSGKQKGLGQGILQRFADEGANCVVSDIVIDDEAESVANDLRGRGAKDRSLPVMFRMPRSAMRWCDKRGRSMFSSTMLASVS